MQAVLDRVRTLYWALACSLVAILLGSLWLNWNEVEVVAAEKPISQFSTVTTTVLISLPRSFAPEDPVYSDAEAIGRVALVHFEAGEPLRAGSLVDGLDEDHLVVDLSLDPPWSGTGDLASAFHAGVGDTVSG